MARRPVVENCMICDSNPCICNAPAPKPPRAVRPEKKVAADKPKAEPEAPKPIVKAAPVKAKPNAMAAMKKAAAAAKPTTSSPVLETTALRTGDEVTPEFAAAVRALGPILHPDERRKYSSILNNPPSLPERRAAWKARTRGGGGFEEA